MSVPDRSDLEFYVNTPLTENDWSVNFLKIIEWLTSGNYDIEVNDITVNGSIICPAGIWAHYTTAERDALVLNTDYEEGFFIWNDTVHRPQFFDGVDWQTL